jgi:type I restriction enzyme S subunit
LNKDETYTRYAGAFVDSAAVTADDVLIGMDGDFNVGRWKGEGQALLNQRMCCVRAQTTLLTRLLEYGLPVPLKAINDITYSTTVKHLSASQVEKTFFAIPPAVAEQTAIATFLDRETAKIDALVAEYRTLIELLKEKRQAVISHAATKGLDPTAPMKDSGVEWLGKVPDHWEITRLGSVFSEANNQGSEELPILTVSIHHGVSDREYDEAELDRKITRSEDRSKYKAVKPGDLVYNMMRAWQGGFGAVTVDGQVSPAYVVARPLCDVRTEFVEQILRSPTAVEEMRRNSYGVTDFRLRLYWEKFKNIVIALPPVVEQGAILDAV